MRNRLLAGALLVIATAPSVEAADRITLSLNGPWEWRYADSPDRWQPIDIPGEIRFHPDHPEAAFRRNFLVPEGMRGRDVRLRLLGVKYAQEVHLNGQRLGRYVGGYEPQAYEVGRFLRFDGPNELLVRVWDWRAALAPETPAPVSASPRQTGGLADAILHPIGSQSFRFGIWQDVELVACRDVWVEDVFVRTSLAQRRLSATVTLAGRPRKVDVTCEVLEGDRVVADLGAQAAQAPGSAEFSKTWTALPLQLWSPQRPRLYHLRVRVPGCDETLVRFGFRDFTIKGADFYLNGTRINLLGTSCHPTHGAARADAERVFKVAREAGCVAVRLHAQPWSRHFYDVADETGMLIVWESALWCYSHQYGLSQDAFWDNARQHIAAQMRLHRNHPSLVIWSAENELLLCGGHRVQRTERELGKLADAMRALDPTRPVMFDGDADPAGRADIVNLHYPHEYPRWRALPEECYWLDGPVVLDTYPRRSWQWDRKKPLYIGEYLWVGTRDPHGHTIFFGDAAFEDARRRYLEGKAAAWRFQIEAYRAAGVSGQCPWNIYEGNGYRNVLVDAVTAKYPHIAAFVREYDSRFFAGDKVTRHATIFNDTPERRALTFRWVLEVAGAEADRGEEMLTLGPAEREAVTFAFTCPRPRRVGAAGESSPASGGKRYQVPFAGTARRVLRTKGTWYLFRPKPGRLLLVASRPRREGSGTLRWQVVLEGRSVFEESRPVRVLQHVPHVKAKARLLVHDTKGKLTAFLAARSVPMTPLSEIGKPEPGKDLVVVGPDAFAAPRGEVIVGGSDDLGHQVAQFVEAGGTAVVLRQRHLPPTLVSLTLEREPCTIAFRRVPDSPLVAGIDDGDLRFWRGDHVVIEAPIRRPMRGPVIPIVDAGGSQGLRAVGLAEVFLGAGRLVLCQLPVVAKADREPAAERLLVNLIGASASAPVERRPLAVLGVGAAELEMLRATGAVLSAGDPANAGVALIGKAATGTEIAAARRLVEDGGTVILHDVAPENAAALKALLPEGAALSGQVGLPIRLVERPALARGLSNEQFYWLGARPEVDWSPWPLSPEIADYALEPPVRRVGETAGVEAKDLAPRRSDLSSVRGSRLWMATNDVAECRAAIETGGTFEFRFTAGGTPAQGVYPNIELHVDGRAAGAILLRGPGPTPCRILAEVPAGRHAFGLAFTNDLHAPPEDRNAYVEGLAWQRVEPVGAFEALTRPAVLASHTVGRGRVIVDQVRWHAAGRNRAKALEFLSALLTNLGVAFATTTGWVIEAEAMDVVERPQQLVEVRPTHVHFATAGRIATEVRFARAGRYAIAVLASGTPVEGVYPICEVSLDGRPVGSVNLIGEGWQEYTVEATIAAGRHTLALAFVNDAWKPPEDRNLLLDRVTLAPLP